MHVSPSSLNKQLNCGFAVYLEYELKLKSVKRDSRYMRGKTVHGLLELALLMHVEEGAGAVEAFARTERHCARVVADNLREEGAAPSEETMVESLAIVRHRLPLMGLDKWETLVLPDGRACVEMRLEHELVPGVTCVGIIDWIARHKPTGKVYIIDHKTAASIDPGTLIEHDLQLALYRWLAEEEGIEVDGAMHNKILSKVPEAPTVLKSGKLSKAKSQATTLEWYDRELAARGEDPEDEAYAGIREVLGTKVWGGYFRDVSSPESLFRSRATAVELAFARKNGNLSPNRGRSCSGCLYRAPCDAYFDGHHLLTFAGAGFTAPSRPEGETVAPDFAPDVAFSEFVERAQRLGRFADHTFTP